MPSAKVIWKLGRVSAGNRRDCSVSYNTRWDTIALKPNLAALVGKHPKTIGAALAFLTLVALLAIIPAGFVLVQSCYQYDLGQ